MRERSFIVFHVFPSTNGAAPEGREGGISML